MENIISLISLTLAIISILISIINASFATFNSLYAAYASNKDLTKIYNLLEYYRQEEKNFDINISIFEQYETDVDSFLMVMNAMCLSNYFLFKKRLYREYIIIKSDVLKKYIDDRKKRWPYLFKIK